MRSELIKLSKLIGKHEIRLVIFKDKASIYFSFPIMSGNCQMEDNCKNEVVAHLENKGLSLDQESGLIVKSGMSFDRLVFIMAYAESLLKTLKSAFLRKTSANYFIGTVESEYRDSRKRMVNAYSLFGKSTVSIVLPHLKKMGYRQVANEKESVSGVSLGAKSIFRKIRDLF